MAPARGRGAERTSPEYRFRHGLVQEAAYGSLVEARRRELHLRVGEALVELNRDSPAEVYGLLAHHFAEADEPERAVEYLLKAGDTARAGYAEEEAIELYRRALGFMERTGDQARARQTLLKIALTHHLAFDYHAANEAFSEAFVRPAPVPSRLEPSERITWATVVGWPAEETAPGLVGSDLASQVTRQSLPWARRDRARASTSSLISPSASPSPTTDARTGSRFAPTPAGATARRLRRTTSHSPTRRWSTDEVASAPWLDGVSASAARRAHARDPARRAAKPLPLPARSAVDSSPGRGTSTSDEGRDWYRDDPARRKRPVRAHPTPRPSSGRAHAGPDHARVRSAWYGARGNVGRGDDRARSRRRRQPRSGGEAATTT